MIDCSIPETASCANLTTVQNVLKTYSLVALLNLQTDALLSAPKSGIFVLNSGSSRIKSGTGTRNDKSC